MSDVADPITIVDTKGETSVHIELRVAPDTGALLLEGQDLGATPKQSFGESEYEYFLTVNADQKDRLLLELLAEKLHGDETARTTLAAWLDSHGIPYELGSW